MIKSYLGSFVVIIILLLSSNVISAQDLNYCGTSEIDEAWFKHYNTNKELFSTSRNCEVNVPMTIHVLGDNTGIGYHPSNIIFNSIKTLNEDFKSSGISFFLSQPLNYINNSAWYDHSSFNVGSQMMNFNNVDNTVNVYIVENAAENCGYRSFSGNAIALAKSCTGNNDHTWAHEMGHYLNLPHTFRGWEGTEYDGSQDTPLTLGSAKVELLDGSNCEIAGDGFCDTPPDYISYRWGCDDNFENPDSLRDPHGSKFKADGTLFMSYALDNCQSRFSDEQQMSMCNYLADKIPQFISNVEPLDTINPALTNLIFPINEEVVQTNVTLKWEESGSATFYVVEVSKFQNMNILTFKEIVYGTSVDVFGLIDNKTYYWRLRPLNEYDTDINNITPLETFKTGNVSSTDDYYAQHLKIFPNPIERYDKINVQLESLVSETIKLNLYSLDGKLASSKSYFIKNGSNSLEIDTYTLEKGIYLLSGIGKNHNFKEKIIIQ